MGQGYEYNCPNCDYKETFYTGIGFMYPSVCEESKQDILNGKWGKDAQTLINNNPDAHIETELAIYKCGKCGNLEEGECVSIIVPGQRKTTFKNHCKQCSTVMRKVVNHLELHCPECRTQLVIGTMIMWD